MTTLHLARHGETDWTREGRWQGHGDPPLNERGREQARELAEQLSDASLDAIYASDLRRTAETAAVVAAAKGLGVRHDAGLRETDFGDWTGLTRAEVERRFAEGERLRKRGLKGWTGGESIEEMAARVVRAVERIAAAHPGEEVLVVTHNRPIRAVHAHVLGEDHAEFWQTTKPPKKGSLSTITFDGRVWAVIKSSVARVAGTLPGYLEYAEVLAI